MVGRRGILLGAAGLTTAVVLDLVTTHSTDRSSGGRRLAVPTPRDAAVRAAVGRERALLAAYETALAAHPGLAGALLVPVAHHRQHLAALTGTAPAVSPAPTPTTAAPGALTAAGVAALRAAVAALAGQERAAAAAAARAATADQENGWLLASIAACESVHDALIADELAGLIATVATTTAPPTTAPSTTPPPTTAPPTTPPPTTRRIQTTPPAHPTTPTSAATRTSPPPARTSAPAPTRSTTPPRKTPTPTPTPTKTSTPPPPSSSSPSFLSSSSSPPTR